MLLADEGVLVGVDDLQWEALALQSMDQWSNLLTGRATVGSGELQHDRFGISGGHGRCHQTQRNDVHVRPPCLRIACDL